MGRALIAATSRLVAFARSGAISAARKVFDKMPERDTVAWNGMLAAYSGAGEPRRALSLFSIMRASGPRPDAFSLTAVLASAADLRDIYSGSSLHALVIHSGLCSSLPVCNSLINMYGKCSFMSDAKTVFDEMRERNDVSWCSLLDACVNSGEFGDAHLVFNDMPVWTVVAWNTLIMGYIRIGDARMSVKLFKKMQTFAVNGDAVTFVSLLNACTELLHPFIGQMIHAILLQKGWNFAVEVNNSILNFYAKLGFVDEAAQIFESMETRSIVSWNAMVDAYMSTGDTDKALSLFWSAPQTNIVSWTTVIGGLSRNGHGKQALSLFVYMTRNFFWLDDLSLGAALHACAILTVLGIGRMIHGVVVQSGFDSFLYLGNGLVNMYAKCGDVESAKQVFDNISNKDLVSWNAILFGYALNGWALRAFEVFNDMLACDFIPDKFTFIGLLMACSHAGLIDRGRAFFEMMGTVYGVKPEADHMTCLVDMLGRAGCISEAKRLLRDWVIMESRRNKSCEALLSACAINGDVSIGRRVGVELVHIEPQEEVGYVMLSNLYCASGQWEEAAKVRKKMVDQGVKKEPGCSWIEARERVVVFVSGHQALGIMMDVNELIGCLQYEMGNPSFS